MPQTLTFVLTVLSRCSNSSLVLHCIYRSVPGKRPLPGKRLCAEYQGVTVAASLQTYGIYIPGKRPCGPKSRVMFKHPWALTRDTTVHVYVCWQHLPPLIFVLHGWLSRNSVDYSVYVRVSYPCMCTFILSMASLTVLLAGCKINSRLVAICD